jgi:hypothetical protein
LGNKEQELKDVLLAIREYKITPGQAKWLQNFQWQNLKSSYGQGLLNDSMFVFPTPGNLQEELYTGEWSTGDNWTSSPRKITTGKPPQDWSKFSPFLTP